MRGLVNDCLRMIVAWTIRLSGVVSNSWLQLRMFSFKLDQKRLKRKYGVTPDSPVLTYGPETVELIQAALRRHRDTPQFARTSGSTGTGKQILYTSRRLRSVKFTFSETFARVCHAAGVKRTCFYVLSSFQADDSLTTLVLNDSKVPNYLTTLQAPYRLQPHPEIQALAAKYGTSAVRLWMIALANPGVLYSTNPSTMATFLDEVANDWRRSAAMIRDWHHNRAQFSSTVQRFARRLESRGSTRRLRRIATSDFPLPLSVCAPAVEAYICWTGGYVKPFLDRVAKHLPHPRYKQIPMYSMSTETIETVPFYRGDDVAFVPMAPGVVYEFIEETALDQPKDLLEPHQLEPGKLYALVVSDNYGLRRYQTNDLFLCKRKVNGLPDLAFARRRTLEYSFTGEKLTGEQLSIVFDRLRRLYPNLTDGFLTCVPSHPHNAMPHYKVMLIRNQPSHHSDAGLAARCDELLCEINSEYKSKRNSGRLGPVRFMHATVKEFAARMAEHGNWESQFKFLPLCRRTWESCSADAIAS